MYGLGRGGGESNVVFMESTKNFEKKGEERRKKVGQIDKLREHVDFSVCLCFCLK